MRYPTRAPRSMASTLSPTVYRTAVLYTVGLSVDVIDLGRLVGYLTPSHVTHQKLLLQFLSAPEDGREKRPKYVQQYWSYK